MTAPTIEVVRHGPEGLPERSLAWPHGLAWTARWLQQPDGPDSGSPWKFTPEQVRFLMWFYSLDERARFTYRYAMLRRLKGWGKDPMAAVMSAIEMLGPSRFSHWDEDGQPVAMAHPAAWVQIFAVSKDQTRNTMTLFPSLFTEEAIAEYNLDIGKEIIYAYHGGVRIEASTSSASSSEGPRVTFAVKSETQHWKKNNGGLEMADTIRRNLAKSRDGSARALAIANAHAPGEGSDAEADWEAYQAGAAGMLYDSIEAPEIDLTDAHQVREGLQIARGDSHWLDVDRLVAEIQDPRARPNTVKRYYLNQIAAGEAKAFDINRWRELAAPDYIVPAGALVVLGFDGSESRDHTALIGTEVATGHQFVVGYWEPEEGEDGELRIPVEEVDEAVHAAFERYSVWRMYADPYYWNEWLASWAGQYNQPGHARVISWPTTRYRRMAEALLAYRNAMQAGELSHDGDERFAQNIANANRHDQQFKDDNGEPMWTIEKESRDSPFKIDAAMAGALSWQARLDAMEKGAEPEKPSVYEERGVRRL